MESTSPKKINLKKFMELSLGDHDFLISLTQQSIKSLKESVAEYEKYLRERNPALVKATIHKIKPTLIILDARNMIKYMEQSNALFDPKTKNSQITENISEIKKESTAIIQELKKILKLP